MKFFSKIFQNFKYKSSNNFKFNMFFTRNMLSTSFKHLSNPHIFLPLKFLKIKIFKNNIKLNKAYIIIALSLIIATYVVLVVYSNRPTVRITGFHPVDPGSTPG